MAANPASGNAFPLVAYQEKGIKGGAYIISAGDVIPATALVKSASGDITVTIAEGETVGSLKTKLGLTSDDYITGMAVPPMRVYVSCASALIRQ